MLATREYKESKTEPARFIFFANLPQELQSKIISFSFFKHLKQPYISKEFLQSLIYTQEYKYCEVGKTLLQSNLNKNNEYFKILNNFYGYYALGLGLMILDEAQTMFPTQLKLLMSENGIMGLRDGLFAASAVNAASEAALRICLQDQMIAALKSQWLTFKELSEMQIAHAQLLADNLFVLKEKLLTLKQLKECTTIQLQILLSTEGVEFLRDKKIITERLINLSVADLRAVIRKNINSKKETCNTSIERRIFGY